MVNQYCGFQIVVKPLKRNFQYFIKLFITKSYEYVRDDDDDYDDAVDGKMIELVKDFQ